MGCRKVGVMNYIELASYVSAHFSSHMYHLVFKVIDIQFANLRNAETSHKTAIRGHKITGLDFFPLPCKLGNSERCVLLACALPSIHGYNFKVVRQTFWQ